MKVLCHGTFDLLHLGHIRLFEEASKLGTLTVSVTADEFVNKGLGRPIFTAEERAQMIRAIKSVDSVEICHCKTGLPMIRKLKPDFYVKGCDYRTLDKHGHLEKEKSLVEELGGRVVFIDMPLFSSTEIIQRVRCV